MKRRRIDVPVVLMTTYAEESQVKRGLGEGVVAVLDKPLDFKRLFSIIHPQC